MFFKKENMVFKTRFLKLTKKIGGENFLQNEGELSKMEKKPFCPFLREPRFFFFLFIFFFWMVNKVYLTLLARTFFGEKKKFSVFKQGPGVFLEFFQIF